LRGERDAMTATAPRRRRLGAPPARARALAAALAGVGAALAVAAAGVQLAPAAIAVTLAWIVMVAVAAMALRLAARAARAVADGLVGRLVERHAGARAGSVVGLLAPRAGGSADLLAAADARAASVVGATAPAVRRALAEGTWRGLAAAAGVAALGAGLFVAAAPASGRAAAFWHPLRTLADARAPVRVSVDRSAVHRGDSVTVSVVALRVDGSAFAGALTPRAGGAWRLALATADGAPLEGDVATLVVRVIADSAPTVAVPVPGDDTTLPLSLRQPLVIDVRDDH